MNSIESKPTSISALSDMYLEQMKLAAETEDAFEIFRFLWSIRRTIDGVNASQGAEYRAIALRQNPDIARHLDAFRSSDSVGQPITESYPDGEMNPTTWRYIKVLTDLQMLFGPLDGWRIAEIGVGYGGQCKIINDLYNVARYTMYDLPQVEKLAEKFLRRLESPVVEKLELADFRQLGQGEPPTYDLVISNWAFSECTREMQDVYIEHVLRRSRCGYITYNQISHFFGIDSYRKAEIIDAIGFPTTLMDEGLDINVKPEIENFVLHWDGHPTSAHPNSNGKA